MLNLNAVGPEMHRSLIKKMGPPLGILFPSNYVDYSDYDLVGARSTICCIEEYKSYSAKTT